MKYMLDTNICIYLIKKNPSVLKKLYSLRPEDICISSVTFAELAYGVEKSSEKKRNALALAMLLSGIEVLDFDSAAAGAYGKVRAALEKSGTPIGPLDTMIAAHGLSLGLTVVTNNLREFGRVEGLKVENWV